MSTPQDSAYARLPFAEAIAFFQQKKPLPTNSFRDIQKAAHDHAFVVAGATKTALLEDFMQALQRQFTRGVSFQDFQHSFDGIIAKTGWDYRGSRAWRSRVIFDTNIRTAWMAGRVAQANDPDTLKALPYWQYKHSGAEHFRPQHKAWDRLVLPADSPFWKTNTPPNGWGCKCTFFPISARQLKEQGKTGPDELPPRYAEGVDPGWAYQPGEAWQRGLTPLRSAARAEPFVPIPNTPATDAPLPPRLVSPNLILPEGLDDIDTVRAFMRELGLPDDGATATDVTGETLMVNQFLFVDKRTGAYKLGKEEGARKTLMRLLARTLKDPDEIYVLMEPRAAEPGNPYILKRRYLARFQVPGHDVPGVVVFDYNANVWSGVTAFPGRNDAYYNAQRVGVRLYRREEASQ
ncbi:MAG: hypothetical protein JNM52_02995 [Betaproteobacteria bacterium]|nr:hypothetical protein [Betaproteobacteria bacterium]